MNLAGPQKYEMTLTPDSVSVLCEKGTNRFSGLATNDLPKLYIVSVKGKPVYVGLTRQVVRSRLRIGMKADGKNGYHGYAWRRNNKSATLNVWCHMDAKGRNVADIETVEAEVVFLIRQHMDQWPASQTEIHFHPSNAKHREAAKKIFAHFKV
jgi:hypothetical protein